jgi:hypothetical protein
MISETGSTLRFVWDADTAYGGETGDGGRIMLQRILCDKILEHIHGEGHNSSYIRKVKI